MFVCGENKPRSLIEQKKLQWAKEREELAKLSVPWGKHMKSYEKSTSRSRSHPKSPNETYYQEENYTKNLPPINQKQRPEKYQEYDRYEIEGDTSGYASDSNKEGTPDHKTDYQIWSNWHRSSESDLSSNRDDGRPKWGDRGLGVGHLWEPRELNETPKAIEPPGWMQRGLRRDKELIVSQSPDQSQSDYLDRPFTGESTITNTTARTHLRGQNIPLEPSEMIERERRRQKALELQSAIKQQLEEREQKRKQEHERQLREEAELEERIRREQELERQRVEEEEKMIKEKKERERQRAEAMQEALLQAEKEAKEKKKNKKLTKSKTIDDSVVDEASKEPPKAAPKLQYSPVHNANLEVKKVEKPPTPVEEIAKKESKRFVESVDVNQLNSTENMIVLQSPFDNMQNMQIALLLPSSSHLPDNLPMVPVSDRGFITENRVLTPSCYRNRKHCRESSTQTEDIKLYSEKYICRDDMGSLDRNRSRSRMERKDKRFRSEDRKENRDRPKWGANRASTRYMKQSDKDPVYQKRKLRQKTREIQLIYEDKNNNYSQSSDDSVPVTPEHKYRQNRSHWHKNGRMFSQNISVYQTEILPLEFDRQGRMYVKDSDYQDIQQSERQYPRQKYRERYKSPDMYAVERLSPKYDSYGERNDHRKMTDRDDDSERTDNEEVLEKLNSLHKGLMIKQKQWENNNSAHVRSTFPSV